MTHDEADIITACLQVLAAIIRSNVFAVIPALKRGGSKARANAPSRKI